MRVEQPRYALVAYPDDSIGCVPLGDDLAAAVGKHGGIVFAMEDAELCCRPTYDATNWDANVTTKLPYRTDADFTKDDVA